MKALALLCVVAAAFAAREPEFHTCLDQPESGPCLAYMPMYYYDPQTSTCVKFIYGGCQGNGNRYWSEEECLKHCEGVGVKQSVPDVCSLDEDSGMCLGYFPRFFYNKKTGECEKFIYGGCQGNKNNFKTVDECETACVEKQDSDGPDCASPPETGPCKALIRRYYYDQKTGTCVIFTYGGCGGNKNNYKSENDCYNKCDTQQSQATSLSACEQEKVVGPCRAYFPRYFYNKQTGKCERFIYGGCQGNENNFETQEDCEAVCATRSEPAYVSACQQEKVVGPCKAAFPRYFYNKETGQCELFMYGGCQGNDNNFQKQDQCEAVCAPRAPTKCSHEPDEGPCRAYFPMYYFDKTTGVCKEFVYGGCLGNENRFGTEEECLKECSTA